MSIEQNKDIALKCFDAINRQDAAGLAAVFSPKWAEEITGWFPWVNECAAGHHFEVSDMVGEGDKVWCRVRTTGTHSGEWLGVPATGQQWTSTGVWFMRIADGRVVEAEWLFDDLNLTVKFGATITPAAA